MYGFEVRSSAVLVTSGGTEITVQYPGGSGRAIPDGNQLADDNIGANNTISAFQARFSPGINTLRFYREPDGNHFPTTISYAVKAVNPGAATGWTNVNISPGQTVSVNFNWP